MADLNYIDRVARGAALLDASQPDWFSRVSWVLLNMLSIRDDVLGQVYGSYSEGLRSLRIADDDIETAVSYGFIFEAKDDDGLLDQAWNAYASQRSIDTVLAAKIASATRLPFADKMKR
jgi:hypothetical protein